MAGINLPFVVHGTITDSAGGNPDTAPVVVRNDRTTKTITVQTNSSGEYNADLANLQTGFNDGDQITVIARFGLEDAESSFVLSVDDAQQQVNITTSLILASSDVQYCTIQDVYDELGDKTTTNITATRVRSAIIRAEGFIDLRTGTSFKQNTETLEEYALNDKSAWASPEMSMGLRSSGVSRSDAGLRGVVDSVLLRNRPVLSIASLEKNTGAVSGADNWTALTEQTGSGGDFILDKRRGILTFVDDQPQMGRKRTFRVTYTWGLDRASTTSNDVSKRELTRELAILISIRSILTSKVHGSQFSGTDSISLPGISISKGAGQSTTYMNHLHDRIEQLFNVLGDFKHSIGVLG